MEPMMDRRYGCVEKARRIISFQERPKPSGTSSYIWSSSIRTFRSRSSASSSNAECLRTSAWMSRARENPSDGSVMW